MIDLQLLPGLTLYAGAGVAALVLAWLAASAVLSGTAVSLPEVPDIPVRSGALDNGLTLIVHEDHSAPIVAVNVWYHVGSKNEKPGQTGFAHLFEHLMFNGSENFNDEYFKVLERLGATDVNGTTNEDRTNYFQTVPVAALDTVLWMESDRMGHLLGAVNQARLDEQRAVVKNEKRQAENEPYGRVRELIQTGSFPKGHPYSWTTIGSMEDLDAASLDDVHEWFSTYYGPSNAVLVLAGDVAGDDVWSRVVKYFGDIPPGPPLARHGSWIARRSGIQRQVLEDRAPQARLFMSWNTPPWASADDVHLDLVARLLASGKTSRLYRRLVYDDKITADLMASQNTAEVASMFLIGATVPRDLDPREVEGRIEEELRRLLGEGPTDEELQRVKIERLADFIRGVERIGGFGGKSDVLAESQVFGGRPDAYRDRLRAVRAATRADVREAAARWLSDGAYVLDVRPFPGLAARAQGADRSHLPKLRKPPAGRLPRLTRTTLSNGLSVVLAENHELPLVRLSLFVRAGHATDSFSLPGLTRLAGRMLAEGTATRSALEIIAETQRLGARLEIDSNVDMTAASLWALRANLEASLVLFADVALNPSFPDEELARLRDRQLATIRLESSQPFGMALRLLPGLIFGEGHLYAHPLTGSGFLETVAKIGREEVVEWHQTWFRPGNATLVVVGDTTLDEARPLLEAAFSSWTDAPVPARPAALVEPMAQPVVYVVDRPGAVQSTLACGHAFPPRDEAREIPREVLLAVLGGQFVSRLNMNLREDKHWTYGAAAACLEMRGPRPFVAYAPVQADKTTESIRELLAELAAIRGTRPATEEEIETAQNGLALTLAGRFEAGEAVTRTIGEIVRFELPDDYYDTYADRVGAVTAAEVTEAAQLIRPNRLAWIIAGDRRTIEPGIKALGLGDVRALRPDGSVQ